MVYFKVNKFYSHRKKASRILWSEGQLNAYYWNNGQEYNAGPWVSSFMGSRPLSTRFKMNKKKKTIRGMDCSTSSFIQILLVTCILVHHWVHRQNTSQCEMLVNKGTMWYRSAYYMKVFRFANMCEMDGRCLLQRLPVAPSKGPNWVNASLPLHPRTETNPVSNILGSLRISEGGQVQKLGSP